jgi:DNA-binding MarR family transcriptional regulator
MAKPSVPVTLAWVRLVRAHNAVLGQVEAALKAAGFPALEWYDVLLELDRGGPMRPRDLQARLLLAQYNLSRLLDRMVARGLAQRTPCPEDGRGHLVGLTPEGRDLRARMWPVYAAALQAALGTRLADEDAAALAALLAPITAG